MFADALSKAEALSHGTLAGCAELPTLATKSKTAHKAGTWHRACGATAGESIIRR